MYKKNGKNLKKIIPSREWIETKISDVPIEKHRAFIACLWLTGARLNEVMELRRRDFAFTPDKTRLKIKLITLKNKVQMNRVVHPYIAGHEPVVNPLVSWIKNFKLDDKIFQFSDRTGERIVAKWFPGWFPHIIRHYRCSHMAGNPTTNQVMLESWFGWSDPKSSRVYVHLNPNVTMNMDN